MLIQFIKFCVVGASGMAVDFGITNYVLNRLWTFHSRDPQVAQQYMQFIGISAIGLLINNLIIYLLNDRARVGFYLSKLIAIGVVTLWNFFMNYFFTFTS